MTIEVSTPSAAGTPPKPPQRESSGSKKLIKDQLALVDVKTADGGTRKEVRPLPSLSVPSSPFSMRGFQPARSMRPSTRRIRLARLTRWRLPPLTPSKSPRFALILTAILPLSPLDQQIARFEDDLTFDKGFFLTIRAIQLLKSNSQGRPILVGVAGPSGAGKSVFCQKIQEFMPGICVLTMDMYNDASMLVEGNFDDPRLTDYETLNRNLEDLKAGKTVEVPIYDFKQSKRVGYRTQECPPSNVIIIEGIYALSDKLRPLQDLRVSISGGVHFDLVKRVMRDIDRSGQEPEDIIHQISETVYPMYKAFIEPDLRSAHLRVVNSFNPFAGFQVRARAPVYSRFAFVFPPETLIVFARLTEWSAFDGR